ncbi:MAG TPA: hypothetical protein VMV49_14085 [Candidatus Deferrimicrobium sp.]|nr:hypothetical protein [Candidatus Deferrimicrobium sp.]
MLKKCISCRYYVRVENFGQVIFHHFCHFHNASYPLVKMQGKLKSCPPVIKDFNLDVAIV